ncbi:hypothetical protein LSTR_LSTR000184 [Laodelphax striatellus]|uniref:Uncharacterized protein n=1 Tax=Laodelphax striatellus TaxID=195883 RepID=A0A482X7R5_LAOST|nr:hypothetical protein LSTR_LSTR000184 [Laodelphax striatellus]
MLAYQRTATCQRETEIRSGPGLACSCSCAWNTILHSSDLLNYLREQAAARHTHYTATQRATLSSFTPQIYVQHINEKELDFELLMEMTAARKLLAEKGERMNVRFEASNTLFCTFGEPKQRITELRRLLSLLRCLHISRRGVGLQPVCWPLCRSSCCTSTGRITSRHAVVITSSGSPHLATADQREALRLINHGQAMRTWLFTFSLVLLPAAGKNARFNEAS